MNTDNEKLTQFKRETKYIQLNGGQSTKLKNQIFQRIWYFPGDFIKKCKYNANKDINIPIEVKNNINQMEK